MPVDAPRVHDARSWLHKAKEDLRAARVGLEAEPPLLGHVVFACQQAAEKTLKGFLTWHDTPFRRTHDLTELGQQCVGLDPFLEPQLRMGEVLTVYAWAFRYPGDLEEPSRREAEQALALADELFATIAGRLPDEARP